MVSAEQPMMSTPGALRPTGGAHLSAKNVLSVLLFVLAIGAITAVIVATLAGQTQMALIIAIVAGAVFAALIV